MNPLRSSFGRGFLAGWVANLISLYWLDWIPFPVTPILGWILLSAFVAAYFGAWTWLCCRIFQWLICFNPESSRPLGLFSSPLKLSQHKEDSLLPNANSEFNSLDDFSLSKDVFRLMHSAGFMQRILFCLLGAALWVTLEMIRCRFLSGFPWNLLGSSQYSMIPLIQISSITGVYGISFLVVWFSLCLCFGVCSLVANPLRRFSWLSDMGFPLFVLAMVLAFGIRQITQEPTQTKTLKLALVQPSIPQRLIWDPHGSTNRFMKLISLTETALKEKPDVVVWPEAGVPNMIRYDPDFTYAAVTNLVLKHGVWIVLGSDDALPRQSQKDAEDYEYFNSAFFFGPNAVLEAIYKKTEASYFWGIYPFRTLAAFLKMVCSRWRGLFIGHHQCSVCYTHLEHQYGALNLLRR